MDHLTAGLLEFLPHCCDASLYLRMGEACALQGECYNGLRPMGAVYWFSLPTRLGLPPTSLIAGHYLLTILSVILSVVATDSLLRRHRHQRLKRVSGWLMTALASLLIHILILLPVLRHPLSDAPASLLALVGTWYLLIAPNRTRQARLLCLAAGGLCLGLAAWMRAFFLYPVLLALGVSLLIGLRRLTRQRADLVILLALVPIACQYTATWRHTGQLSFLEQATTEQWTSSHLDSVITGYDTLLPFDYHAWYAPCQEYRSLSSALRAIDLRSVACVVAGRAFYYLGSYSPYTYLPEFEHQLATQALPAPDLVIGNAPNPQWLADNFDVAVDPADPLQLKLTKIDTDREASLSYRLPLDRGNEYNFGLHVSSPESLQNILVGIQAPDNRAVSAAANNLLIPVPGATFHIIHSHVRTVIDQNGIHQIKIISPVYGPDTDLGRGAAEHGVRFNVGSFYIKNPTLNQTPLQAPADRRWSIALFIVQVIVVLASLTVWIPVAKHLPELTALTLLTGSSLLCLVVVPEQRFALYPLITFWVLAWSRLVQLPVLRTTCNAA